MDRSREVLKDAVDNFGSITGVRVKGFGLDQPYEIALDMADGTLYLLAMPDDDTIRVTVAEHDATDDPFVDESSRLPWRKLIGAKPIWMWLLTNQQGYVDGFQVMALTSAEETLVQVQVLASTFKAWAMVSADSDQ